MLNGLLFRMPRTEALGVVFSFMHMYIFTDLIIEAEDGGCEHQELGAHHQHACGNIVVCRYAKRGESKADGCKE